jgi:uncharacterized RDD family membrane protein YckC
MTRSRVRIALLALAAAFCAAPLGAVGQDAEIRFESYNPALRILRDYTLRQGDTARHVVVIGGNAKIEGHVYEDVVVILGRAELASTAVVDGNFVSIAGEADIADGARVNRDFVVVGDAQTPASFQPGGQHVVVGLAGFGGGLRSIVPWLTHGLLLGRPIVPWLGWVWVAAAIFFFINFCVNMLFDGPVRASTGMLQQSPLSAFMAGLLVLLLAGPVCLLMVASVIGIAVVPFVLCALVAAAVIGRVAFARWVGMRMMPQGDLADRAASTRSFVIGSAVICVAYMIPFIGMMVWALSGVFGLGAATLAFNRAYRRENPKPPKPAKADDRAAPPVVPPAAPPVPDLPLAASMPSDSGSYRVAEAAPPAYAPPPPDAAVGGDAGVPQPAVGRLDLVTFPKAMFGERLAAFALDVIAIALIAQLLSLDHRGDPGERLFVFLALVYHVGFWTWRATTPGGMICQLRVVRTDGKALDFPEALVRGLTGIFSIVVAGLGFFWMLRDPDRQTWHDRVAGTYVVKVPRAYPI